MGDTIGPDGDTGEAEVAADTGLDAPTYAYLFEVMYDEDGPSVKYGMDVSGCVSNEYREAIELNRVANKAAAKIGAPSSKPQRQKMLMDIIERDKLDGALGRAGLMFTRARMTGTPLYLIRTGMPLTFEWLDRVLKYRQVHGLLRKWLEEIRVA